MLSVRNYRCNTTVSGAGEADMIKKSSKPKVKWKLLHLTMTKKNYKSV
jgi:hypothetical protein